MSEDLCALAADLATAGAIQTVHLIHLGISTATLVLIGMAIRQSGRRLIAVHWNFQAIIFNSAVAYSLHCIAIIFSTLFSYAWDFAYAADCIVWPRWACYVSRAPIMLTVSVFTVVHFAAFVERSLSIWRHSQYEEFGRGIGLALTIMIWSVPIICIFIQYGGGVGYAAEQPYCMGTTPQNQPRIVAMYRTLFCVDVVVIVGDFMLQRFSQQHLDSKSSAYTLSKSYQINENFLTARLVFPVAVTHSLFFLAFLFSSVLVRRSVDFGVGNERVYIPAVEGTHTIVLVGIMVTVFVYLQRSKFLFANRRSRNAVVDRRVEADLYFRKLNEMLQ